MTRKLTEAGYDPTRIEERARVLAKARGLIGASRKRDADDMEEMDDEDAWSEDAGDDSMEVDGDGERAVKRSKTSIVPKGKRTPVTNRETAGLGSMVVRLLFLLIHLRIDHPCPIGFPHSLLAKRTPRRLACCMLRLLTDSVLFTGSGQSNETSWTPSTTSWSIGQRRRRRSCDQDQDAQVSLLLHRAVDDR